MFLFGAVWDWALGKIGKFVPTPGNILETMSNAALDGLKSLMEMVEKVLVHPPRPAGGQWLDDFYGQSLGFSPMLAIIVAIVVTVIAMFKAGKFERVLHAWLIVAALGIGLKPWYGFCTWVVENIRDPACEWAMNLYEPTKTESAHGLAKLLDVSNPFGIILGAGGISALGFCLMLVVTLYELMIIFVTFGAPIAFALSAAGSRAQAFLHGLISVGIVSMTIGAPVAILFMEVGEYAADHAPFHSITIMAVLYMMASLAGGLYMQWRLFKATNQQLQNVTGRAATKGKSVVSGKVKTEPAGKQDVRIKEDHAAARARSLRTQAPAEASSEPQSRTGKAVGGIKKTAAKGAETYAAVQTGGVSFIASKGAERLEQRAAARNNGSPSHNGRTHTPAPGNAAAPRPAAPSPSGPSLHAKPQKIGANGLPTLPKQPPR